MNITPAHLLESAHLRLIRGGREMKVRRAVVIHFTSGATAQSSIDYWNEPPSRKIDLGAHIVIDRDGTVFQCRPFNLTISHAGISRWRDPKTGNLFRSLNGCAIGIELANAGDDTKLGQKWSRLPLKEFRHRNGGAVKQWEQFPPEQIAACGFVTKALVLRYNLDDVTSHDCIAPGRKVDVGPAFPLQQLREMCGFSGLPEVFR